ncbi:MAG: DinB family protein [Chloroflexota bacterium]
MSDFNRPFAGALRIVLDETFDDVKGIYLDKGTSFFETLADITAEEASIPVGGKCATLAAQVKHVAFYLDVVVNSVRDPNYPRADWDEIWRTVEAVSPEEWQAIQDELRASYERILELIEETPSWEDERQIAGAIGVVAHTAYHLGEVRQALCTLRPD